MKLKLSVFLNCLTCFLILLLCSDFKMWSVMNVYAYSYLRLYDQSLQMSDVNEIFFWISFATNTGIQCGLYFAYKFGFRLTLIVNGLICAIFVLASSFCTSFYAFTFTFGVGNVFFAGMIYLIAFDRAYKMFPKHKEITSGFLNVVFGLGLLGQGELYFLLVNRDNDSLVDGQDYYEKSVADNLPWALRVIAIIYTCFVIIATFTYKKQEFIEQILDSDQSVYSGENIESPSYDNSNNSLKANALAKQNEEKLLQNGDRQNEDNQGDEIEYVECQSYKQAILSVEFIKIFVILFFVGCFGTMIIGNYKPYGQNFIKDDSYLTLVGTISGLLNGLSGLVWGPLQSKINYKYNLYIILTLNSITAFLFPTISENQGLFFFFTCLSIFCYGGVYSVFPIMTVTVYGGKMGTRMIGTFFQALTLASLFQYLFLKYVSDWNIIFYTYGGLSLFGLALCFLIPGKVNWNVNTKKSISHISS